MILGIDASTPGSGGGRRHLIEILKRFNSADNGFSKIRIWGVRSLLDQLPDISNVEKISHPLLNKGFFFRLIWQLFFRDRQLSGKFDILLSPFGTYSNAKIPYVSMSRNMLVFDTNEQSRFDLFLKLKFKLLQLTQINSFKHSRGVIFLSKYAEQSIRKKINLSGKNTSIIHHGISSDFRGELKPQKPIGDYSFKNPYELLYVSSIWPYKHQWNIVKSISKLRQAGYPVVLRIVGSNDHPQSGEILKFTMLEEDPHHNFIFWEQGVSLNEIAKYYKRSNGFIFASTCENMPNILVEAMSSGIPILCSNFQPMPEFLKDGGMYFDPTSIDDTTVKIKEFIDNPDTRVTLSTLSSSYSKEYNWDKCASETYRFLHDNVN